MKELTRNEFVDLHISKGNMKLGGIPNISLAPLVTCSAEACATCGKCGCYACKSYRQYPNVRKAWNDNTTLARIGLKSMETGLNAYFDAFTAPRFFRLHVGGDFDNLAYAQMWYRVIKAHPHTTFYGYTKRWDVLEAVHFYELENMHLYASDWPECTIPADVRAHYPIAWLDDGTRPATTFPADVFVCGGDCSKCGHCITSGKDVLFKKH